jgi:hypothetical protein
MKQTGKCDMPANLSKSSTIVLKQKFSKSISRVEQRVASLESGGGTLQSSGKGRWMDPTILQKIGKSNLADERRT